LFELIPLKLLHHQLLLSYLSSEHLSPLLHLVLGVGDCFEGMIFVLSEESTVGAKSFPVSQADDFELFVVDCAYLCLLGRGGLGLGGRFGGLLLNLGDGG